MLENKNVQSLKEKAPNLIAEFQRLQKEGRISHEQRQFLTSPRFLSALSNIVNAGKIKIEPERLIEGTRGIATTQIGLLKVDYILEQVLAFVATGSITFKQFIARTPTKNQICLLSLDERFFGELSTLIALDKITFQEFFNETQGMNNFTVTFLWNKKNFEKTFAFIETIGITLRQFIEEVNKFNIERESVAGKRAATARIKLLCNEKFFYKFLTSIANKDPAISEELRSATADLTELQFSLLTTEAFLNRLSAVIDTRRISLDYFIRNTKQWNTTRLKKIEDDSDANKDPHLWTLKAGLCLLLSTMKIVWHLKLNRHQLVGRLCGLSEAQVDPSRFSEWHAELATRGEPYENYGRLSEHQAKGICYGLTLSQVDHLWFKKQHAELAEKGVPYDKYNYKTDELVLRSIAMESYRSERAMVPEDTEFLDEKIPNKSNHRPLDDKKQMSGKSAQLDSSSNKQIFWNNSSSAGSSSSARSSSSALNLTDSGRTQETERSSGLSMGGSNGEDGKY